MHLPLTKKVVMQWLLGNMKERVRAAQNNDFGIPQNTEQVLTGIEAQAKKPVMLQHVSVMPTKTWWWLRTLPCDHYLFCMLTTMFSLIPCMCCWLPI